MCVGPKRKCELKLITKLALLLFTLNKPVFADVVKLDDGSVVLRGKDALNAIEKGVVLSSQPGASTNSNFYFVLLYNKRVWDCDYSRPDPPNMQSAFWCSSDLDTILDTTF